MLDNYLADLKASLTASPIVEDIDITDEFITSVSGFLECRVLMVDGSMLKFSEYFTIDEGRIKRNKYSFHLQKNGEFILRWDNAPHHKELSTHPFHVHRKNGVHDSRNMTIDAVLGELSEFISDY